jgi:hypothetical protein
MASILMFVSRDAGRGLHPMMPQWARPVKRLSNSVEAAINSQLDYLQLLPHPLENFQRTFEVRALVRRSNDSP